MEANKTLIYKAETLYLPVPGEHLTVEDRPFDTAAAPPTGGLTVKNLFLSLDPSHRGQMYKPYETYTYAVPWVLGQPARVTTLGSVIQSDNTGFRPGDLILAFTVGAAAEYTTITADQLPMVQVLAVLERTPPELLPPSRILNALGIPGLSAYESFFEYVKEPRDGKTIFITAASGAVGQIVGQLAKMHGMKVIGSTGSREKVDFVVKELGYDAAWNYKTEKTTEALAKYAPEGLDVYYDNVGGEQLEAALTHMKDFGTVIASGMVAVYGTPEDEKYGVRTLMEIFLRRLTVQGFICSDHHLTKKYMPTFARDMIGWIAQGKIKTKEHVVVGIENAPQALIDMWTGDKFGKMVVQV